MQTLLLAAALALLAAPLAAQAPDTLSAAQTRQRASWAEARARSAQEDLDILRDHLSVILQGAPGVTASIRIPSGEGWGYIEVRQPGKPVERDSVWFEAPQVPAER